MFSSLVALRPSASSGLKTTLAVAKSSTSVIRPSLCIASRRYQSSSSINDVAFNDLASIITPERPIHASSMDRIDLAHGSFFALHRPLLGVTSVPMETQSPSFQNYEGKSWVFSSLGL